MYNFEGTPLYLLVNFHHYVKEVLSKIEHSEKVLQSDLWDFFVSCYSLRTESERLYPEHSEKPRQQWRGFLFAPTLCTNPL